MDIIYSTLEITQDGIHACACAQHRLTVCVYVCACSCVYVLVGGRLKGGRLKVCVILLQEGTEDIATSVNTRVSADKVVIISVMDCI